jgi:uncharacterized protein YuzE
MEKFKLQLSMHPDLGLVNSFKMLDSYDRGYFDLRDIQEFITDHSQVITIQRAERILRRLDIDYDGKVIYQEWNKATKPRNLNDTLLIEIDQNENWLKEQEMKVRVDRIISPQKYVKDRYNS